MAISKSLILRGMNGSMAGMTFVKQQDRVVVKEKATNVRNPRTAAQQVQRLGMRNCVRAWQQMRSQIVSGIRKKSKYGSAYNSFVHENLEHAKTAEVSKEDFVVEQVIGFKASIGTIEEFKGIGTTNGGGGYGVIIKTENIENIAKDDDEIVLLFATTESSSFQQFRVRYDSLQETGTGKLADFPISGIGFEEPVIFAVWFESSDGKMSSTSTICRYN